MSDTGDREERSLRREVSRAYARLVARSHVRLPVHYRIFVTGEDDTKKFFRWLTTEKWFRGPEDGCSHVELRIPGIEAQISLDKLAPGKAKGAKARGVDNLKDLLEDAWLSSYHTYALEFFYMEDVKKFLEFVPTLRDATLWIEDAEISTGKAWKEYVGWEE